MNEETKYISIDLNVIQDILTLKQIQHSINAFDADVFNIVIENDPDNYNTDEENGSITAIKNPLATIYIAQKVEDNKYSINEIITNELELNNSVFAKYDVINFDISGVTCRGMILDFDSNESCVYLELLVINKDGLSTFTIPFDESSNIEHVARVDQGIIECLMNSISRNYK